MCVYAQAHALQAAAQLRARARRRVRYIASRTAVYPNPKRINNLVRQHLAVLPTIVHDGDPPGTAAPAARGARTSRRRDGQGEVVQKTEPSGNDKFGASAENAA